MTACAAPGRRAGLRPVRAAAAAHGRVHGGRSRWSARCCCGWVGCSSAAWRRRRSRPAAGQHGPRRRAGSCRAEQVSAAVGAAAQRRGAARRADRLPAGRGRRGRSCRGGWSGGCSARCTPSRPRRGGCRSSRSTPALALRDARGEVAELAAGFDAMLDRLQAAFEAQRRFVANASHELRTPLAVLRTEVDVTLADPDADVAELRRMGEVVREATPPGRRPGRGAAAAGPQRGAVGRRSRPPSAPWTSPTWSCPRWPRCAPRPCAAACGCSRAPRTGADGAATRCCSSGWPATSWRTRCGTTSPAGWLEICTGPCAGPVGGAARQLRGTGDRSGAGGGAVRAVPAGAGGPHGRHAAARGWGSRSSARWCSPTAARWRPNRCRAAA